MNSGAFGENFPYSNFHDLNLDWVVKIAKDFLDQYTHIQQVIQTGLEDLTESRETGLEDLAESRATGLAELNQKTLDGLADLQEKYDTLNGLLQAWYDTHSADIAEQLADAIADFNTTAEAKSQALLDSWPDDYSELVTEYNNLKNALVSDFDLANIGEVGHYYINKYDRSQITSTNYTSVKVQVKAYTEYHITADVTGDGGNACTFVLYDSNMVVQTYGSETKDNTNFTPSVTGYLVLTNYSTSIVPECVGHGVFVEEQIEDINNRLEPAQNSIAELESNVSNLNSSISEIESGITTNVDIAQTGEVGHYYVNKYDRSIVTQTDTCTSVKVPVTAGIVYHITADVTGNTYACSFVLYNSEMAVQTYGSATKDNESYTPTVSGYLVLTNSSPSVVPICTITGYYLDEKIDMTNRVVNQIKRITSNLEGKTVIWFGTSIPAGNKENDVTVDGITAKNNYPDMISKLLNCTIINKAIGTSTARAGIHLATTYEDDPLGVRHKHYQLATRGFMQTSAEKESFITNWDTLWGPNGTYNLYNAPNTLSAEEKATIRGSSYEVLLTPYLNGTHQMPDVFVIDHGWNDAAYGDDMTVVPDDPNDRLTYIGAMNCIVRMILEANNKAKIILIGHFEDNTTAQSVRTVNAQKVYFEFWNFPGMHLWDMSNISGQTITVNGETVTMKSIYCPDGVHPHKDLTGNTNMMLARKIAKWMAEIF